MIVDKKIYDLIEYLIQNKKAGTITNIAKELEQNRRVIYYNLDKLNDEIEKDKVCSKIFNKQNIGIVIDSAQEKFLKKLLKTYDNSVYFMSIEERKLCIAILIATYPQKITIDFLIETCFVSRNTIVNDLKDIKENVLKSNFNVTLEVNKKQGYFFLGSELELVQYVYYLLNELYCHRNDKLKNYINNILNVDNKLFSTSFYVNLLLATDNHVNILGKEITSSENKKFLFAFPYIIATIRKMEDNIALGVDYITLVEQRIEYKFISGVADDLYNLSGIKLNENEKILLTIIVLCLKKDLDSHNHSEDYKELIKNIKTMINIFDQNAGVSLKSNDKFIDRLTTHFKSLLFRKKFNIVTNNTLTDSIIHNYKDVFLVTRLSVKYIESVYKIKFTKSDIAYLSLHFGSELVTSHQKINKIKKVLIVTEEQYSIQHLIENQCKHYLTNCNIVDVVNKEQIKNYSNIDFLISTEFLDIEIPYVVISPLITTEDITKIVNFMQNIKENDYYYELDKKLDRLASDYIKDKHKLGEFKNKIKKLLKKDMVVNDKKNNIKLKDILIKNNILIENNVHNLKEAINILSKSLVFSGKLSEEYVNKRLKIDENYTYNQLYSDTLLVCFKSEFSYTNPNVAMLLLKDPLTIANRNYKTIFLLTTLDNMEHLNIISDIDKLARDKVFQQNLESFVDEQSIIDYIYKA